jgi:hypothetical protein
LTDLELLEFLLRDLLVLSELFVLGLVDQDDPVSLQERLRQQTLRQSSKPGPGATLGIY